MMNLNSPALAFALCLVGCTDSRKPEAPPHELGGCSSDRTLPALNLTASDRRLLSNQHGTPRTAADFYLKLPAAYFPNLENTSERRVSFIDKATLTDGYLEAKHWFECDGGGFSVTIRVFDTNDGPLIAIHSSTYESEFLLKDDHAKPGELQSISVQRPKFWRYRNDQFVKVDDGVLPTIRKDFVLDRYHHHYKGQLKDADQQKYIWLTYDLPATGTTVRVTGRENFMDPMQTYTWKTFQFNGKVFVEK